MESGSPKASRNLMVSDASGKCQVQFPAAHRLRPAHDGTHLCRSIPPLDRHCEAPSMRSVSSRPGGQNPADGTPPSFVPHHIPWATSQAGSAFVLGHVWPGHVWPGLIACGVAPAPTPQEPEAHRGIINQRADVAIVVAAMIAKVDYLVTLNRRHFIGDPAWQPDRISTSARPPLHGK